MVVVNGSLGDVTGILGCPSTRRSWPSFSDNQRHCTATCGHSRGPLWLCGASYVASNLSSSLGRLDGFLLLYLCISRKALLISEIPCLFLHCMLTEIRSNHLTSGTEHSNPETICYANHQSLGRQLSPSKELRIPPRARQARM